VIHYTNSWSPISLFMRHCSTTSCESDKTCHLGLYLNDNLDHCGPVELICPDWNVSYINVFIQKDRQTAVVSDRRPEYQDGCTAGAVFLSTEPGVKIGVTYVLRTQMLLSVIRQIGYIGNEVNWPILTRIINDNKSTSVQCVRN